MTWLAIIGFSMVGFLLPEFSARPGVKIPLATNIWCAIGVGLIAAGLLL